MDKNKIVHTIILALAQVEDICLWSDMGMHEWNDVQEQLAAVRKAVKELAGDPPHDIEEDNEDDYPPVLVQF